MGGKRVAAAMSVLATAGLLTGCCLFSGTATVTVDFATTPGSGSYAAGRFMLQFQWPRTTTLVTLDGTYNPYANELSGDWLVGGIRIGTWRVMRN